MSRTPLDNNSIIEGKLNATNVSFEVSELLGYGGSGYVYLCRNKNESSGKYYAVKEVYPKELANFLIRDEDNKSLFFRSGFESHEIFNWYKDNLRNEVEFCQRAAQSRIRDNNDPYFLTCLGIIESNDTLYAVYDTFNGLSLETYIKDSDKDKEEYLKTILAVLAIVSKKLHIIHTSEKPILHLDLSPSNIFLAKHGNEIIDKTNGFSAYLLDFGSAYDLSNPQAIDRHRYSITNGFSAPELYARSQEISSGYNVTAETDTYSLAAILFYALTGKKYDEECVLGFVDWEADIVNQYSNVQALVDIIKKGLSSQGSRYATADEFAEALLQIRQQLSLTGNADLNVVLKSIEQFEETVNKRFDTVEETVENLKEKVEQVIVTLTNASSKNINNWLMRSKEHLENNDWDKAIDICNRILNEDPSNIIAHLYILLAELKVDDVTKIDYCNVVLKNNNTLNWLKKNTEGELFDIIDDIPPMGFINIKSFINEKFNKRIYSTEVSIYFPSDMTIEYNQEVNGCNIGAIIKNVEIQKIDVSPKHLHYSIIDGVLYSLDKKTLIKCPSEVRTINIPSYVCDIADYAFYNCTNIRNIEIPNSVTNIGSHAFYDCESIKEIVIPNSVTMLGEGCFEGCSALINATISNQITELKECSFKNCSSLPKIIIPNSVINIGSFCFYGCKSLKAIEIPQSVTSIGESSFALCIELKNITIPDTVFSIGESAFFGCWSLTNMRIPSNITVINRCCFARCEALQEIIIPDNVNLICNEAFFGCDLLEKIIINEGVVFIGNEAFALCNSLKKIYIPASVEKIESNCFNYCNDSLEIFIHPDNKVYYVEDGFIKKKLRDIFKIVDGVCFLIKDHFFVNKIKKIIIPNGINKIGDNCFEGCDSLEEIIIPESVKCIGDGAFSGCFSLKKINVPKGVTNIGDKAFEGCKSLKEINLPTGLLYIGGGGFLDCQLLETVNIPEGITEIHRDTFRNCNSIKKISMPDNIISIGAHAFDSCWSLENITLPECITSIGEDAFMGCSKLKSINIPKCVKAIENYTFAKCKLLEQITIHDNVITIGDCAFWQCENIAQITLSNNLQKIGREAFSDCKTLKEINIPNGVTTIELGTFGDCKLLERVGVHSNIVGIGSGAFSGCENLKDFNFKLTPNIMCIGSGAFTGCTKLGDIELNIDGFLSIRYQAFSFCHSIKSVYIPENVVSIGTGAFAYCKSLKRIDVATENLNFSSINGVLYSKNKETLICHPVASDNDPNLNLHFVKHIDDYAFASNQMEKLTIPEGIITIGRSAFSHCEKLEFVELPHSLTEIHYSALRGCDKLNYIVCSEKIYDKIQKTVDISKVKFEIKH